ncbi:MAG TPA: formylglycine-generating enzyme family protein [Gemmataceae bacterium]|nr:formylglycine-generating enzyme family protein [Gemmataceae bacterium]
MSSAITLLLLITLAPGRSTPGPAHVPGPGIDKQVTNSIGMKLTWIAPGKFMMGSTAAEIASVQKEAKNNWYDNEGPQHEVEISKGFYLGVFPVTQAQYRQVMGKNPSWFSSDGGGKDDVAGLKTDDFPVEMVSWGDAKEFCKKLSKSEGKTYRLPTEAEWEYACRAGTRTHFATGDGEAALKKAGWFEGNSGGRTQRVGQLAANAWGLHDMHGNVCQWCEDWFEPDYYQNSPKKDPTGPAIGECRVLRGGSYRFIAWGCRCATRIYGRHDNEDNDCGFRVVLIAP